MNFLFSILLLSSVGAQAAPTDSSATSKSSLDEFFKDKTRIENPLQLRDPFKSPQLRGQQKRQSQNRFLRGQGDYSNIAQENLRDWNVHDIRVVGVMIGKQRRAIITRGGEAPAGAKGGRVVVIKEGQEIGPDKAVVKAILPGGIILVEKIINVYGQEEYLETVVPISK